MEKITTASEVNLVFQWIPSHRGVAGNETLDKIANEGTVLNQKEHPISFAVAKTR